MTYWIVCLFSEYEDFTAAVTGNQTQIFSPSKLVIIIKSSKCENPCAENK